MIKNLIKHCLAPADTACGNLDEATWWQHIKHLSYTCKEVKKENVIQTVCTFECVDGDAFHAQTGRAQVPSVESAVVCEQFFVKGKKGKPTTELEPPAWIDDEFISSMVECQDPQLQTECGDVLSELTVNATVGVTCDNNVCTFSCSDEDQVPSIESTTCGIAEGETSYAFNPAPAQVTCIAKPDDTVCGNVREYFFMSDDTEFTVSDSGDIVMFQCGGGKLASPATTFCDTDTGVFSHEADQPIRCF